MASFMKNMMGMAKMVPGFENMRNSMANAKGVGTAEGGRVHVVTKKNAEFCSQVLSVKIDPAWLKTADAFKVEAALQVAVNEALMKEHDEVKGAVASAASQSK